MPTIDELDPALAAADTDVLPASQGGVLRRVNGRLTCCAHPWLEASFEAAARAAPQPNELRLPERAVGLALQVRHRCEHRPVGDRQTGAERERGVERGHAETLHDRPRPVRGQRFS